MKHKKYSRFVALLLALIMCFAIGASPAMASSRAISIPTQYAPDSFYNVAHQWTATYYTYSSYIFTFIDEYTECELGVFAKALKPFTLELYSASSNELLHEIVATRLSDSDTYYQADIAFCSRWMPIEDFYIILRNNDATTITLADEATYYISNYVPDWAAA